MSKAKPDWMAFGVAIMDGWPEPYGAGMDVFELQELAEEHGILTKVTRQAPCHSLHCSCAEFYGDGETIDCYEANYEPS